MGSSYFYTHYQCPSAGCTEPRSWVVDSSNWGTGSGLRSEGWYWNYADYGGTPSAGGYFCQLMGSGNWNCGPGALSNLTNAQRYTLVDSNLGPFAAPPSMCTIGDTYGYSLNEGAGAGNVEGYESFVCQSGCPATCTGDPAETQWVPRTGVCPVGQVGSVTWEQEQERSRVCTSGTWSSWGMWSDTANTRNMVNTCVPATCSGSPTETQWVPRSAACPVGQTGSNTWEAEQVRTRVCSSGTWGAYGGWSDTGATRNALNTCAPPVGGTMCMSGTIGYDVLSAANWWCPGYNTTLGAWPLERPAIFGANDLYVANVTDDPQVTWDDPPGGGVITGWVTMPRASWQSCGVPAADMLPAVGQYFHSSIYPLRSTTPLPAECLSSGNYVVMTDSCAAETPYAAPDLDTQARAACNGAPNGSWTANLHHFPSASIGCYTVVECR